MRNNKIIKIINTFFCLWTIYSYGIQVTFSSETGAKYKIYNSGFQDTEHQEMEDNNTKEAETNHVSHMITADYHLKRAMNSAY